MKYYANMNSFKSDYNKYLQEILTLYRYAKPDRIYNIKEEWLGRIADDIIERREPHISFETDNNIDDEIDFINNTMHINLTLYDK